MSRLQHAVDDDGADVSRVPPDDPVFLVDEVAGALRLSSEGAVYRNAQCREVQAILTDREEVELAFKERVPNTEVITAPDRTVGVEVFKPTATCREVIQRRLKALTEPESP